MKKKILSILTWYFSLNIYAVFVVSTLSANAFEAQPAKHLLKERWKAHWISHPTSSLYDYSVYHFRKTFELNSVPGAFIINISADNRYRLFVNGTAICEGPARGDLAHWYFETVDISSLLKKGKNTLAVSVWNFGDLAPAAQISNKTALIIQGNSPAEEIVNTGNSWKVIQNKAYSPSTDYLQFVGCADEVDASLYPWDWEKTEYDDSDWLAARQMGRGLVYGTSPGYDWVLCPRDIPLMEESLMRMKIVRRSEGISVPKDFLEGNAALKIPQNKKVSFLIDQTFLTNAYPELKTNGGKGSEIKLTYNEGLFKDGKKGNRNDVDGYEIRGFVDKFYPDGGIGRLFRPLWFRTYRYVQVNIETKDEALEITDLYGKFTAYPFVENGSFESDAAFMKNIWDIGWRTARLCAHEIYFDCPYYEQLQYVGDTRIQALISLYVDGDDRLMRKAIRMFDWSRSVEGITTSRYPSSSPQYIPPFSLYWVNMVHDYWMHRDDDDFIGECFTGIKSVLDWYIKKIDPQTGMLGKTPHWNFVDGVPEWPWSSDNPLGSSPPGARTGGSSILTMQLAYTLQDAIELFTQFGDHHSVFRYKKIYDNLRENVLKHCWDEEKQLMWDDINKTSYSQHAGIMGILSNTIPADKQKAVFTKLNTEPNFIQTNLYYRFYLFRALKKVGLGNQYTSMLQPWLDMMNVGLTTFAENPEPTRSDCHAWSSSPLYDFLATICGVEPASPGFKTVKIEPHLGNLKYIKGKVPHPSGIIEVNLSKTKTGIKGTVILPQSLSGQFIWSNYRLALSGGENKIVCK